MSNATVEKAVTFSTFPAQAHKTYADQTTKKPLLQGNISTEIHSADIQLPEIEKLFGCLHAKTFAQFPRPKGLAGAVFQKKLTPIDLDTAHDKLQDFLASQISLTSGNHRSKKSLDDLITTVAPLNRILELIRGYMCQYAKG